MKNFKAIDLINSLSLYHNNDVMFLLGAGCSIGSGCMAAGKLINEFKRRIYCAKNGIRYDDSSIINDIELNKSINEFFHNDVENEYSFYFEKCFPNPNDRIKFVREKFLGISPSYGYLCLAKYLMNHSIKYVLTTNFDQLCQKAVGKLNEKYDMVIMSDSLSPKQEGELNIIELHGDYNYDSLKNTKDELESLSQKIHDYIQSCRPKKIVVIGYSGQDKSVMSLLNDLTTNFDTEILWCTISDDYSNDRINNLLSINQNSGYVKIDGFEQFFYNLYKFMNFQDELIDSTITNLQEEDIIIKKERQIEDIYLNINYILEFPYLYVFDIHCNVQFVKEINEKYNDIYILQSGEKLYAVGNIVKLKEILKRDKYVKLNINNVELRLVQKCQIMKHIILCWARNKGLLVFKNNIYSDNKDQIKQGLKIDVDIFNNTFCLITCINYFSTELQMDERTKYAINRKKSELYAKSNFDLRKQLLEKYLGKLEFDYYGIRLKFDSKPVGNFGICQKFDEYDCGKEPLMVTVDGSESVNQLKLLTEKGPRKTLLSPSKIKVGIFCVKQDEDKLKKFLSMLINGFNTPISRSIFPTYKGFESIFETKIEFIFGGLNNLDIDKNYFRKFSLESFAEFCCRGIKKLYDEKNVNIVLIFIGNNLERFKKGDTFDLHDYIKVKCANSYKTQFLEESTLDSTDDINKCLLNLSIALYTKSIGMPWYPKEYSKNTLFLGISFGVDKNGVNVGCSQMFDGAGRGLQLIITKVSDKHRKNQYLSLEEAYNLGLEIRKTYYNSSKIEEIQRIVIHRCDPFRKEEIEGFKKAFAGIEDFVLVQITERVDFNAYKFKNHYCFGYPVSRGTMIKCSKNSAYIWTDGSIINTDVLGERVYRNNTRGMGKPLKIIKYHGNITLNEIVEDLLILTKMDFNSSDVMYSKLPVTIKYSRIVCDLLKQGSFSSGKVSFEYIM